MDLRISFHPHSPPNERSCQRRDLLPCPTGREEEQFKKISRAFELMGKHITPLTKQLRKYKDEKQKDGWKTRVADFAKIVIGYSGIGQ